MIYTLEDVAQNKLVDGELVPLTTEERQAIADEWNLQRPTPFHSMVNGEWVLDERLAHNTPIDAQIEALERAKMRERSSREVDLALIVERRLLAKGISPYLPDDATTEQKSALKAEQAIAMSELTNPEHPAYNRGFANLLAFDNEIRALRVQRIP